MPSRSRTTTLAGILVFAGSGLGLGLAAPAMAVTPAPTVSVTAATAAPVPAVTATSAPTLDPGASAFPVASPTASSVRPPTIAVPAGNARLSPAGATGGSDGASLAELLGLAGAGSALIGGAMMVRVRRRS
ncbi:MAG: hypothetical protein JWO63_2078 [Frankiales bacterium]|nr:hypothetical protein [Frankiales bacterium]